MKRLAAFIVLLVAAITSCKKESSPTSGTACTNSFTFLKNGDVLTYSVTDFIGDTGRVTNTFTSTSNAGVFLNTIKNITTNTVIGQTYNKGCNGGLFVDKSVNVPEADSLKVM